MGVDTFAGSFGFMSHHQINAHFVCTGRIKPGTEGVSAFMRCIYIRLSMADEDTGYGSKAESDSIGTQRIRGFSGLS